MTHLIHRAQDANGNVPKGNPGGLPFDTGKGMGLATGEAGRLQGEEI
jgi:hypothetical protein